MTAPTPSDVLVQYARALSNAAPKEFAALVQTLDAYAMEVTVAVTIAPQDQILNAQGKAQAFIHLLNLFRTAQGSPQP